MPSCGRSAPERRLGRSDAPNSCPTPNMRAPRASTSARSRKRRTRSSSAIWPRAADRPSNQTHAAAGGRMIQRQEIPNLAVSILPNPRPLFGARPSVRSLASAPAGRAASAVLLRQRRPGHLRGRARALPGRKDHLRRLEVGRHRRDRGPAAGGRRPAAPQRRRSAVCASTSWWPRTPSAARCARS